MLSSSKPCPPRLLPLDLYKIVTIVLIIISRVSLPCTTYMLHLADIMYTPTNYNYDHQLGYLVISPLGHVRVENLKYKSTEWYVCMNTSKVTRNIHVYLDTYT